MRRALIQLWHRFFPPPLTEEWLREVQEKVFNDFRASQQDIVTPLMAAINKGKEDA
jgi:hypothetical protein